MPHTLEVLDQKNTLNSTMNRGHTPLNAKTVTNTLERKAVLKSTLELIQVPRISNANTVREGFAQELTSGITREDTKILGTVDQLMVDFRKYLCQLCPKAYYRKYQLLDHEKKKHQTFTDEQRNQKMPSREPSIKAISRMPSPHSNFGCDALSMPIFENRNIYETSDKQQKREEPRSEVKSQEDNSSSYSCEFRSQFSFYENSIDVIQSSSNEQKLFKQSSMNLEINDFAKNGTGDQLLETENINDDNLNRDLYQSILNEDGNKKYRQFDFIQYSDPFYY